MCEGKQEPRARDIALEEPMASNFDERKQDLAEINTFIETTDSEIGKLLAKVGWTKEYILNKSADLVSCPYDDGHKVPATSLQKHVEKCSLLKQGCSSAELEQAQNSSSFFSENTNSVVSVSIDQATQDAILSRVPHQGQGIGSHGTNFKSKPVPLTSDRAIVELTPAERLAIYEYSVSVAKQAQKPVSVPQEELMFIDGGDKKEGNERKKSRLEILAEERDYKRRRQSYRAKNVHITKKSYTEIIREVVNKQMDLLKRLQQGSSEDEKHEENDGDGRGDRKTRKRSPHRKRRWERSDSRRSYSRDRSRSSSKEREHSSSRRVRSRSRSKERSRSSKSLSTKTQKKEMYDPELATVSSGEDSSKHRHHKHKKKHKHKHKSGKHKGNR